MRVIIIPDTHFPFVHREALSWVLKHIEALDLRRGDHIIQIGDLYDFFAHSKFPRSLSVYMPDEEIDLARQMGEEMWAYCAEVAPRATRWQLLGNHDIRPLKRALERNPESERAVESELKRLMTFKGVKTVYDPGQELEIDVNGQKLAVIHGYYTRPGKHRDDMQINVAHGHTHTGGVYYATSYRHGPLWELDAGFLGDVTSKALTYRKQNWTKWTLGFGLIDELGPRFIPYRG